MGDAAAVTTALRQAFHTVLPATAYGADHHCYRGDAATAHGDALALSVGDGLASTRVLTAARVAHTAKKDLILAYASRSVPDAAPNVQLCSLQLATEL